MAIDLENSETLPERRTIGRNMSFAVRKMIGLTKRTEYIKNYPIITEIFAELMIRCFRRTSSYFRIVFIAHKTPEKKCQSKETAFCIQK